MGSLAKYVSRLSLEKKKITVSFGLALAALLAVGVVQYRTTQALIETDRSFAKTDAVIGNLAAALSEVIDADSSARGYVATGDKRFAGPVEDSISDAREYLHVLRRLTLANPGQQRKLDRLAPLVERQLTFIQNLIVIRRDQGFDAAVALMLQDDVVRLMNELRGATEAMEAEEKSSSEARLTASHADARNASVVIVFGTLLALGFILAAGGILYYGIAERRRAERELKRVDRALRAISDCNQILVRAADESQLLKEVCELLVSAGGYCLAWVGYAEHDEGKSVRPVAHAGYAEDYLDERAVTWADTERGRGPTGTAIRTGKPSIVQRIQEDPRFAPWWDEARKKGYESSIALPLSVDGRIIGALVIHCQVPDAFDEEEVALLAKLADDLAFGIQTLRMRADRARTEQSRLDSETRFRLLFAANPLPMWVYDLETLQFLEVNDAAVTHYGYSREEFLELRITEIRPLEDVHLLTDDLSSERFPLEDSGPGRHTLKDGRIIDVQITSHLMEWDGGHATLVVAQDVTVRKRAEEALRKSERQYRQLHESLIDGFVRLDFGGRITETNDAFCKMLGYTPEEILKLTHWDLTPEQWHDFEGDIVAQEVLKRGYSRVYLKEFRHKHGRIIPTELRTHLMLDDSGNACGTWAIVRDITERKRAEEMEREYEKVVEGSSDMITVVDREYRYLLVNHAFLIQRGLERNDVVGYSLPEILGGEFFERVVKGKLDQCFQGNDVCFELKYQYPTPEIGERDLLASYFPIEGQNGVDRVACVIRDITESKRADEALRESEERFRGLVENASVGIYRTTPQGRIVMANPALVRMLGYKDFEDLAARNLEEQGLEPGYSRRNFREKLERDGQIKDLEAVWERRDGSLIFVRESARVVWGESGDALYYDGFAEDITERKRAEEEMLFKTALLEAQSETTIDGILVVDMTDHILLVNEQFARMWNIPEDAIHTKDDKRVMEHALVQLKDPDAFLEKVNYLYAHEAEKSRDEIELKDGRVFDRYSSPLQDSTGRLHGRIWYFRDITERKRAEDEVYQSRQMLQVILHAIPQRVFWKDRSLKYLGCNRALAIDAGLKDPAEIIGKTDYELSWSKSAEGYRADDKLVMEQEEPRLNFEEVLSRPDESLMWLQTSKLPLSDRAGHVIGVIGTYEDITERKRGEVDLRASETRYRRLFEAAHDGILILDAGTGEIRDVNPFLVNLLGYSQDELVGKKLWDIGPLRDVLLSKVGFDELQSKEYIRYENLHLQTHAGKEIEVEFVSNLYLAGDVKVIQCDIRDITERRRGDEERARLTTAIEQASEGVVITDRAGTIQYVNPAFSAMTGYSPQEALGKNPRILNSGKHPAEFYVTLWATVLAGQVWKGEVTNRRKDGSLYVERMSITPVFTDEREITHLIAMKEDITDRKLLENQYRQAQKMEAVGRLAAGVAHDFNNLLTIINGYNELMIERFAADDPMRAYASEIKGAGERAVGLTRQLLAFSRQQVLAPRVLDLNTLIANVSKMLKRLIGEDISMLFKPVPLPVIVKADPGLIEQALMNLAVNSRDAMPHGGELTIQTSHVQADEDYVSTHYPMPAGSYVMLTVSDTGSGMDKEIQSHIFEPFFTTKEQGKGTGLGLATVYGIVKQTGGFIWVYSEPGAGTCFKIYLPVAEGAPAPATQHGIAVGGSETVLLVEDDDRLRVLARMILETDGGYSVLESSGGKEALRLEGEHTGPIHLLLTDVVMPGMSGRELSERLAGLRPKMKILYMSGYTDDTVVRHGILEAEMAFIQKPFSPESLLRKVREVLNARRLT